MKRKDSKNRVLKDGESQRPNGTYEFKTRDSNGKRYSVYAKTLDQLREKEEAILKDRCNGVDSRGYSGTVNDLCEKWFSLQHGRRETTITTYKEVYAAYIKNDIGVKKVKGLKKTDVVAYYVRLHQERGISYSTIGNVNSVLSLVFGMALDDELMLSNPLRGALKQAKGFDYQRKHKRGLTVEEQRELERWLPASPYARYWPVISFMMWTGLRIGEVSGLRWCDIDLDNGTISIKRTFVRVGKEDGSGGTSIAVHMPKTKAGVRTVPLMSKAREALLAERSRQDAYDEKPNITRCIYDDVVFLNNNGTPFTTNVLNGHLKKLVEYHNEKMTDGRVALPHISNHTLRHTFATRMYEAGVSMKAMQTVLGHSAISTTMDIYTDASDQHVAAELSVLDKKQTYDKTYDRLA